MSTYYLQYNGSNSYVTVASAAAINFGTSDISMCFWVYLNSYPSVSYTVLNKGGVAGAFAGYWIRIKDTGKVWFLPYDGGAISATIYSTDTIPLRKWTHVCCTIDRSESNGIKIYINAEPETIAEDPTITLPNSIDTASDLCVGAYLYSGVYSGYLDGSLDDVRFYKAVLTEDEVTTIYKAGVGQNYLEEQTPTSGAAVFVLDFNEGTGTSVTDSASSLPGTISGDAVWNFGGASALDSNSRDLIIYYPNHGYSEDDLVYISWLEDYYYVNDPNTDSFKITSGATGPNVVYTEDIIEGYVRKIDSSLNTTVINGLDHLEGEMVCVTSGGKIIGYYEVSSGSITVPYDLYSYQAGLTYTMKIKTTRIAMPQTMDGIQTRIKRINETVVRYIKSVNGQAGQEYNGTEYTDSMNASYSNESKDAVVLTQGGFSEDGYTLIKSSEPYPFNVLATIISLSIDEE